MPTKTAPDNPAGTLQIATRSNAGHLSRLHKRGDAIKLATSLYVVDASLPIEALARRHVWKIIAHYWPDAVVCDCSAFDGVLATGSSSVTPTRHAEPTWPFLG